ncbi:MAG TPA: hypothetical protein VF607_10000, partial [Verrucomicrobiae bacterium]
KPVIQLQFTDLPMLGNSQNLFNGTLYALNLKTVSFKDCWLRGAGMVAAQATTSGRDYIPSAAPTVTFWNNVLERSVVGLYNGYYTLANNPLSISLLNNTAWFSTLTLNYQDSYTTGTTTIIAAQHPSWTVQDNLFDNDIISFAGTGSYLSYVGRSYNGYAPSTSSTFNGASETMLTSVTYATYTVTGIFPSLSWYVSSTPPVTTTDFDSTRNGIAAKLYYYTRQTSQTKEGSSALDLGFHYVALTTVGFQPVDTDGDGVPDYLEDTNSNGTYDSGTDRSNWNAVDTDGDGLWDDVDPVPGTVQSPAVRSSSPSICPVI